MQEIGKFKQDINVISNDMEKYMTFMIGKHLVFLDSFHEFMSSSLDNLVKNLPGDAFKYTSEEFQGEKLKLMTKKGVYPYDYMDSFDKFEETLPRENDFYSILADEHVSDEAYEHAENVWRVFELENMGGYHDLYLKSNDERAPSNYITYLDVNNLYGWSMSQYLPTGGFKWLTEKEISKVNLAEYKEDSRPD